MDKKTALINATFGSRVAEEELDGLRSYFVETEHWRKLFNGDVDIVYGSKGAGKPGQFRIVGSDVPPYRTVSRVSGVSTASDLFDTAGHPQLGARTTKRRHERY
jgi:hypothetical protein